MTARTTSSPPRDALGVLMPGFVGSTMPGWLGDLLREGLGGVCLFAHNVDGHEQVSRLIASIHDANPTAIVSVDEEGGDVSRLHQRDGSPFPGNAVLGRLDDPETTRSVARRVGVELASVGIDMALAPDADLATDPDNPVIGVRSFGADPAAVAVHTAAWTDGVQAAGVAACAKHFPGHGDTSSDSHVSVPVVSADRATLDVRELAPFRAAIAAGSKAVMTSHLRVPAMDPDTIATFSPAILTGVLRDELGFDGVVVTDALDMVGASGDRGIPAAAVAALSAGADLLCIGSGSTEREVREIAEALVHACTTGTISPERVADGAARCRTLSRWSTGVRTEKSGEAAPTSSAPSLGEIAASFTLSERARTILAGEMEPLRWVKIEPEPNVAIGTTPFGPFFEGGAVSALDVPVDDRAVAQGHVAEPGALTIVVGREFHRDPDALDAAVAVAASGPSLIVDMGMAVSEVVDIATFGASRLVGEALLHLVGATPSGSCA